MRRYTDISECHEVVDEGKEISFGVGLRPLLLESGRVDVLYGFALKGTEKFVYVPAGSTLRRNDKTYKLEIEEMEQCTDFGFQGLRAYLKAINDPQARSFDCFEYGGMPAEIRIPLISTTFQKQDLEFVVDEVGELSDLERGRMKARAKESMVGEVGSPVHT